jgi:integral membrane protein
VIGIFRLIALVEGVTTVALFLVAMPLKYVFDQPQLVPPVGMAHGVAFVAYIAAMWLLLRNQGFTQKDWTRTALAAFYPFGTFLNDGFLRRKQLETPPRRA